MTNLINDFPINSFASEEKQIILTVHQIMEQKGNFSFQERSDLIIFRMHNLKKIEYKKIKEVMLCNNKIKNVVVHFGKANTVAVHIKRDDKKNENTKRKTPTIINKKRRRQLTIKNEHLKQCALKFLSKKDFIRKEDKRYLSEIVTKVIQWSIGSKAISMELVMHQDEYVFKVGNLSSISYADLQQLPQVGNWVKNIRVVFKENAKSLLLFEVIRSVNYINNGYASYNAPLQLGKRKLLT
jgi:hypothetical protein